MAALTADIELKEKDGSVVRKPAAVDVIYKGALVKNNAAGYAEPCAAEAGATFAGVANEQVDNIAGSAGDKTVNVTKKGIFLLTSSGLAQSDVGSEVYASDDQTVSTVQGANEQAIGKIVAYESATQAWVDITGTAV